MKQEPPNPSKALKALRKKAVRILEVKKRKANHKKKEIVK